MIPGDRNVPPGDYRCRRLPDATREALAVAVVVLVGALFLGVVLAVLILLGWLPG